MVEAILFIFLYVMPFIPRHDDPVYVIYPEYNLYFPLPSGMCNVSHTWDAKRALADVNEIADLTLQPFNAYFLYTPCSAAAVTTFFGVWSDFGLILVFDELPLSEQVESQEEFNSGVLELSKSEELMDRIDTNISTIVSVYEAESSVFDFDYSPTYGISPVYLDDTVIVVHRKEIGTISAPVLGAAVFDDNTLSATTLLERLPVTYQFVTTSNDGEYLNSIVGGLITNAAELIEINLDLLPSRSGSIE